MKLRFTAFAAWLLAFPLAATAAAGATDTGTPTSAAAGAVPAAAAAAGLPYTIERFTLPGPIAGVLARVALDDPRVHVGVALADPHDPDGDGPMTGQLAAPSEVARRLDFAVTLNGGYFRIARSGPATYISGDGASPAGWHFSDNKLVARPNGPGLRATMVVRQGGAVSLLDDVQALPPDTRFAVSGSAMVLAYGVINPPVGDYSRHPRSAVGIDADGRTLLLLAIDGRQDGYSRGASLGELAAIMREHGAFHAINLDGGGSSALVVKDAKNGDFRLMNRPSDRGGPEAPGPRERPVADVIGVWVGD